MYTKLVYTHKKKQRFILICLLFYTNFTLFLFIILHK